MAMTTGWIVPALFLLPNLLCLGVADQEVPVPPPARASALNPLKPIEQISRVALIVVPLFFDIDFRGLGETVALAVTGIALAFYYALWLRYLIGGRSRALLFRPLFGLPVPMAVLPVAGFLAASVPMHAWPLAIAALVFGAAHIPLSLAEARRFKHYPSDKVANPS
jgi:hypothetical protein